jgi:uncharacterized membrane protein
MNPYWIIAFLAGAGVVASFCAFAWACITRQFTGYDFGGIPLNEGENDAEHAEVPPKAARISRIHKAVFVAGLALAFGLIGWMIYLTIAVSSHPPAAG